MTTTITTVPAWIADGLLAYAEAMEAALELPVSLPEPLVDFVRPPDGRYVIFDHYPNVPLWEGLAASKVIDQGILLARVRWPKNRGIIGAIEDAGRVAAYFGKHTLLISGPVRIKVQGTPRPAAPMSEIDGVTIPVTIPWTATAV